MWVFIFPSRRTWIVLPQTAQGADVILPGMAPVEEERLSGRRIIRTIRTGRRGERSADECPGCWDRCLLVSLGWHNRGDRNRISRAHPPIGRSICTAIYIYILLLQLYNCTRIYIVKYSQKVTQIAICHCSEHHDLLIGRQHQHCPYYCLRQGTGI